MLEPWHDKLLDAALDTLEGSSFVTFANHWRGAGGLDSKSSKSPRNARFVAVEYARLAVADFDQACLEGVPASIEDATNRLKALASKMEAVLSIDPRDVASTHIASALPLCRAIARGILAAIMTKVPLPAETTHEERTLCQAQHLAQASQIYEDPWGLGFTFRSRVCFSSLFCIVVQPWRVPIRVSSERIGISHSSIE